jgi:hypothetical protein
MLLPVPVMVSISSNEPITLPVDAFVMTCNRDGVWPSLAQPATTVSHASTGDPVLASTNSSAAPVEVTFPENAAFAVARAFAALTFGVVPRDSGADRPTELPVKAPSAPTRMMKSPPYTRRPWYLRV